MKRFIASILVSVALAIIPAPAFTGLAAAACPPATSAKGQVLQGVNETGSSCSEAGVTDVFGTAVNILSFLAGAVGVIMVIVAGFKYITSNGDSSRVGSAKTTLVYAMVGLVIAALAQFLVHYVIHKAGTAA